MFVHNGANGSESYVSSSSPGGDTGDDCKLVAAGGNKVQNIKPRNVRNYTSWRSDACLRHGHEWTDKACQFPRVTEIRIHCCYRYINRCLRALPYQCCAVCYNTMRSSSVPEVLVKRLRLSRSDLPCITIMSVTENETRARR